MFETRRQVFRASVLSAFGLISLPVLAGCSGLHGLFQTGQGDPNVPVVGKGDDKPYWYLFVFDAGRQQYKVWRTDQQPPSNPDKVPFDTADWYSNLEGTGQLTLMTSKTKPPVKIDGRVYDTDQDGYLTGPSTNTMQHNATTMKWMEVSKK